METAIDAIVCADQDGTIVYANPAAAHLLGYSADELPGTPLISLIPERLHERHKRGVTNYLATGAPQVIGKTIELEVRHKSGGELPVELSLTSWDAGDQKMFAGIMRDIRERMAAQREILRLNAELEERVRMRTRDLERSNRDLERFAFVAAHDLQEPLRTVTGFAQLLARRYRGKLDARADGMIDMVVSGASWMHSLTNDLLAYSRLGTVGLHLDDVDCEKVLERALANLERSLQENGARVTHVSLPVVAADEAQLVCVFQNLIGNALKFHGEEAPRIHLSARQIGEGWEVLVRDNGIGIAREHLERIFEVFERLHTRDEYPGTGIGLPICRRILERLEGSIWAESEPGCGSTMHVVLPARYGKPAAPRREGQLLGPQRPAGTAEVVAVDGKRHDLAVEHQAVQQRPQQQVPVPAGLLNGTRARHALTSAR